MSILTVFCNIGQDYSLTLITVSHSLTVSNNEVYSNDEFDLWPVYLHERFRASWPSCFKIPPSRTKLWAGYKHLIATYYYRDIKRQHIDIYKM